MLIISRILTAHVIHVATSSHVMYRARALVAVALTLLVVCSSNGRCPPPPPHPLFFNRQLCIAILDRLQKNEQKVNVGRLQISYFFAHAASNLAYL